MGARKATKGADEGELKSWVAVDGNKLPPQLDDGGASAEFVIKGDGKVGVRVTKDFHLSTPRGPCTARRKPYQRLSLPILALLRCIASRRRASSPK